MEILHIHESLSIYCRNFQPTIPIPNPISSQALWACFFQPFIVPLVFKQGKNLKDQGGQQVEHHLSNVAKCWAKASEWGCQKWPHAWTKIEFLPPQNRTNVYSIFNVAQMKFWHLTNLRLQKLVGPFLYSNAAMVLKLPSSTSRTSWSTWLSPASSLSFPSQWHSSSTLRLPCWRDPTPMSL